MALEGEGRGGEIRRKSLKRKTQKRALEQVPQAHRGTGTQALNSWVSSVNLLHPHTVWDPEDLCTHFTDGEHLPAAGPTPPAWASSW